MKRLICLLLVLGFLAMTCSCSYMAAGLLQGLSGATVIRCIWKTDHTEYWSKTDAAGNVTYYYIYK